MSQAGQNNTAAGPVPPTVATSYVTDVNSPAIPAANVLDVIGGTSTANTVDGIRTDGSSGSNILTIQLTNRVMGTLTTTDSSVHNIISFPLSGVAGVYDITGTVSAFDLTAVAGASYGFTAGIRSTGASAIEIGTQFSTNFEEAALIAANIGVTVSGNNVNITVQGVGTDTIHWNALFTYIFVS